MKHGPHPSAGRRLLASLLLAGLLAAVPLTRLTAAAHDPARSGAATATRVPLMLETGARMGSAGMAATVRVPALPRRTPAVASAARNGAGSAPLTADEGIKADHLVALGRLQLEGG